MSGLADDAEVAEVGLVRNSMGGNSHQRAVAKTDEPTHSIGHNAGGQITSTTNPSVVSFVIDHPRLALAMAILAIAIAFSQKASVIGVSLCLFLVWIILVPFVHDRFSKPYIYSKTVTFGFSAILGLSLLCLGFWLTQSPLSFVFKNRDTAFYKKWWIEHQITSFHNYLADVGFTVSQSVSPIDVTSREGASMDSYKGNVGNIHIAAGHEMNTMAMIYPYAETIFSSAFVSNAPTGNGSNYIARIFMADTYANFFVYSYCDYLGDDEASKTSWIQSLWEMRSDPKLGRMFVERSLLYASTMLGDTEISDFEKDFGKMFMLGAMKMAYEEEQLTLVRSIFKRHGINGF